MLCYHLNSVSCIVWLYSRVGLEGCPLHHSCPNVLYRVWGLCRWRSTGKQPMLLWFLRYTEFSPVSGAHVAVIELTALQYWRQMGEKLAIALVVSVGSGIFPVQDLGKTDAQQFLYFGKHWLKAGHSIKARAKSLVTLLTTAVSIVHATSYFVLIFQPWQQKQNKPLRADFNRLF